MKPSIKSHLRVECVDDDKVFLIGEQKSFLLRGSLCARAVPLMDGTRTVDAIIRELPGTSPAEIYYLIEQLRQGGYLSDGGHRSHPASYVSALGMDVGPALGRMAEALVAVDIVAAQASGLGAEAMATALERAGLGLCESTDAEPAIRVVVTDDYLHGELGELGRRARAQGQRWLIVKPVGVVPWFGPVFGPEGPCWECMAQRLEYNRAVEKYVSRRRGLAMPLSPPPSYNEASVQAAMHLAGLALARWIAEGGKGWLEHTLVSIDLGEMATERHPVVRLPQCKTCGNPELRPHDTRERPLILVSQPQGDRSDSGQRIVAPEATYERLRKHISSITGVVSSVSKRDLDDEVMPLFTAVLPNCPVSKNPVYRDFARSSWGKGATLAQSRTSALCEALERLSARFRGDEPRLRARMDELGPVAVSPHRCILFSDTQYQKRHEINASVTEARRAVPVRFDPSWDIDWTPAWSLTRNELRYLPTVLCYDEYDIPIEQRFCFFHANGHAAGNCLEEAILQGFLELCERDAVALWWYNRLDKPAVDLDSFGDEYLPRSVEHYRRLGFRMWVLDVTADLDIPTFVAVAVNHDDTRVFAGFACHVNAHQGVRRAITELGQMFHPDKEPPRDWAGVHLREHHYLFPRSGPMRRAEEFRDLGCDDVRDTVHALVERAAGRGLETIVLDQTRPDLDICAAKVVVPGLRHFWRELGPGRLYDVPVELGWLGRAHSESELNPMPIFW